MFCEVINEECEYVIIEKGVKKCGVCLCSITALAVAKKCPKREAENA